MVQEQVANKMMAELRKYTIGTAAKLAALMTLIGAQLINAKKTDALRKKIANGGELTAGEFKKLTQQDYAMKSVKVEPEDLENWKVMAQRVGIAFISYELKDDNAYYIRYMDEHSEKAQSLNKIMLAINGTEPKIDIESFSHYYEGFMTREIRGLTEEEREVFKQNAYETGLMYSVIQDKHNGLYNIFYGTEFEKEAERTLALSCLDLTSKYREEIKTKIDNRLENKKMINDNITRDNEETIYIVSVLNSNRVIKLTNLDYTDYNGEKVLSSLNKDEPIFDKEFQERMDKLGLYSVFTESDYHAHRDDLQKEAEVRFNIFPGEHLNQRNLDVDKENIERVTEAASYSHRFKVVEHAVGVSKDSLYEKQKDLNTKFFRDGNHNYYKENNKEQQYER